ncbi:MAG: penicillin-binding protein activator [Plesiomonas sp.]|uniref:penicillin-binding protein activator n=1 Tax=Plesiomonas sp. TaxID=2486279 RepID=UPI003EE44F32
MIGIPMLASLCTRVNARRIILPVFATLMLAACQMPQRSSGNIPSSSDLLASSAYYLQQANTSSASEKTPWQLLAVQALLKENNIAQATAELRSIQEPLSDVQRHEQQLLWADIALAQKDPATAATRLATLNVAMLTPAQKARYYRAKIALNSGQNQIIEAVRDHIALDQYLTDATQKQQNNDQTWLLLTKASVEQLSQAVVSPQETILVGWLDLARVYQENRYNLPQLKAGIAEWKTRFPKHPAAITLPTPLSQYLTLPAASMNAIGLLLPISGQNQALGDAIRQGFMAGMLEDSARNPNIRVQVYDTATKPLPALLQQAEQEGVRTLVGPLLKNRVDELMRMQLPADLSILTLNQPETPNANPSVCYYALSPEDEASDAAQHIWDQGQRTPLVLVPSSPFGQRVGNAFSRQWQTLSGEQPTIQYFGDTVALRQSINQSLRNQGKADIMRQALGVSLQADAMHGPIDAIYYVTTPDELALLKPFVDASIMPGYQRPALYASSRSNQAGNGPDFRLEMDGVQFSDIPMLTTANSPAAQRVAQIWRNPDYSLSRLYAMGMDAWSLANHMNELRQVNGYQYAGQTGLLSAGENCTVNRQLNWLRYQNGGLLPVASANTTTDTDSLVTPPSDALYDGLSTDPVPATAQ